MTGKTVPAAKSPQSNLGSRLKRKAITTPKMVVMMIPNAMSAAKIFIGMDGGRRAGVGDRAGAESTVEFPALGVGDGVGALGGFGVRLSLICTRPASDNQAGAGSPPGSRS